MLTFIFRFSRSFFSVGSNGKHDNRAHERDPLVLRASGLVGKAHSGEQNHVVTRGSVEN